MPRVALLVRDLGRKSCSLVRAQQSTYEDGWGRLGGTPVTVSASSQVVKPSSAPPIPPVKPKAGMANPGPTQVSPLRRAVSTCKGGGVSSFPSRPAGPLP